MPMGMILVDYEQAEGNDDKKSHVKYKTECQAKAREKVWSSYVVEQKKKFSLKREHLNLIEHHHYCHFLHTRTLLFLCAELITWVSVSLRRKEAPHATRPVTLPRTPSACRRKARSQGAVQDVATETVPLPLAPALSPLAPSPSPARVPPLLPLLGR